MSSYSTAFLSWKKKIAKIQQRISKEISGSSFIFNKSSFVFKKRTSLIFLGILFIGTFAFLQSSASKEDFSLACASISAEGEFSEYPFLNALKAVSPESPELILAGNRALKAASPPADFSPEVLGDLITGKTSFEEKARRAITEYVVKRGESLSLIAENFDISLESLLWANDLSRGSVVQPGEKLIVPPVTGVIYHIKRGDTVSQIAETYEGKEDEIVSFNTLSDENDIFVGDIIVIPNGEMPSVAQAQSSPQRVPLANSYFICPISSPCTITQGLHWYNAIDFSHGKCGEPIYAAASGKVLKVGLTNSTSQWANGGAGNFITILHPNGAVTMYGHLAASLVSPGERVSQGQMIALMGGQPGTPGAGMSTGCHVHFSVSGARNPFAY